MKIVCGIEIDEERIFISLAYFKKQSPGFIEEVSLNLPFDGDIPGFFKKHFSQLSEKIREREKNLGAPVRGAYVILPFSASCARNIEETVPLKKLKKINAADIRFAKKYVENLFLEWDDHCLHHILKNFEVDGVCYKEPPIGVWAKKIKLNSFLIWTKSRLHNEMREVFGNMNIHFMGFISQAAATVAMAPALCCSNEARAAVGIGYNCSLAVIYSPKHIFCVEKFDFGVKSIIEEMEREFSISLHVAWDIFNLYLSFKDIAVSKELSVKTNSGYVNLSASSVISFIKSRVSGQIGLIAKAIKDKTGDNLFLCFSGRLSEKEGFADFIKSIAPCNTKVLAAANGVSSSLGGINYGACRFLEGEKKRSLWAKACEVYKEYF